MPLKWQHKPKIDLYDEHAFHAFSEDQDGELYWNPDLHRDQFGEVVRWCTDQFGSELGADWSSNTRGVIWINNDDHAMAFKMRWF